MKTLNENLQKQMDAELAPYLKTQEDRFNRYMDCQDDSIMGGLSWEVTKSSINRIKSKYERLNEQLENGGFFIYQCNSLVLFDLNGKFITDVIIDGDWGKTFIPVVDGKRKYISLAKKQSTYAKKGYVCKVRNRQFKVVFKEFEDVFRGKPVYSSIELLSETFSDGTECEPYNTHVNELYEENVKQQKHIESYKQYLKTRQI